MLDYSYIFGIGIIFVLICVISYLSIYKIFIYVPQTKQIYIDPELHSKDVICSHNPKKCVKDDDCDNCIESSKSQGELEITCQEIPRTSLQSKKYGKSGGKYCLPKKADQPCNQKLGGMWTWSGYSSLEGTGLSQEWDCVCTIPEIAAGNGCPLNANICQGGDFYYDATGKDSNTPPHPVHCRCPENSVKILTSNGSIICSPYNAGYCADEKGDYNEEICSNFFTDPNDKICGLDPRTGTPNDCGIKISTSNNYKMNDIMCADLLNDNNKKTCMPILNDKMNVRGVKKCHELSRIDLAHVGELCGGIPKGFTKTVLDDEKNTLCNYIITTDSCKDDLATAIKNPAKSCEDLDYSTVFNIGIKCKAFPSEILSI